jgi:protein-tyrosine phosphatase
LIDDLLHPQRHLALEGAHNIRDMGGYPTIDGRRTRWGRFLRADGMHQIPRESQDALIDYGVRTVVDLRLTRELDRQPDVFVGRPEVKYHHENLLGDEYQEADFSDLGEPADRLFAIYTMALNERQPALRRALGVLADPADPGGMFHCTAGKDRTGIISALLLGLAGVPSETIAEDYGLSARYLLDRYLEMLATGEMTSERAPEEITWQTYQAEFCPPGAMLRVLQHLDDRYGGIKAYVRAIGVTSAEIDGIRTTFVE